MVSPDLFAAAETLVLVSLSIPLIDHTEVVVLFFFLGMTGAGFSFVSPLPERVFCKTSFLSFFGGSASSLIG